MIQRKQTIFLFLALIVTLVCLCLPIGSFEPQGMGADNQLMNLWLTDANGGRNFNVWALFAILLVTCPIDLFAIFDYHNRKRQARFCLFSMLMIIQKIQHIKVEKQQDFMMIIKEIMEIHGLEDL